MAFHSKIVYMKFVIGGVFCSSSVRYRLTNLAHGQSARRGKHFKRVVGRSFEGDVGFRIVRKWMINNFDSLHIQT
jgi:hypothetical protein